MKCLHLNLDLTYFNDKDYSNNIWMAINTGYFTDIAHLTH